RTANTNATNAAQALRAARENAARIKRDITVDVLSAQDERGKAKFGNETARACAIESVLADCEPYLAAVASVDECERLKTLADGHLEYLRSILRIDRIDYEAEKLGKRDAA